MSSPAIDLSKVQYTSLVNSFKNDSAIYTGSLTLSAVIPGGSFLTSSTTVTLASSPQFSMLYGFFQEFMDATQQYNVGSGYNTAQWYLAGINNKFGLYNSSGKPPLDGIIYPVINGNQVTVTAIVNNPYATAVTPTSLTIPFAFIEYTMTN